MSRSLRHKVREARSGKADGLVIFAHGYGADGNDLLGLSDYIAPHLPNLAFAAPDAPMSMPGGMPGYRWFPIPFMDGSSIEESQARMHKAFEDLDSFIDQMMAECGVGAGRVVLYGFSQGTMMSLHVGPRRSEPLAGIMGFSGRLIMPEALGEVRTKPPVALAHGDSDELVPPASMGEAEAALRGAGFAVETHMSQGTGHGIAPDGLAVSVRKLKEWLG